MKAIFDGNDLAEAVAKVIRAVSVRTTNPVFEHIKIDATSSALTVSATDNELYIRSSFRAEVTEQGSLLVPGKLFYEFTRRLASEQISIYSEDTNLHLDYKDSHTEIACLPAISFPLLPSNSHSFSFSMPFKEFKDLINKVAFAAAQDDSRPILKGVCLELSENKITAVAIDGYRLARCIKPLSQLSDDTSIVVSVRALNELIRLVDDQDMTIKVSGNKNRVYIDLGHTLFSSTLLNGDFVPYENIIPSHFETSITLSVSQLAETLDRAILIAGDSKKFPIRLEITERTLSIICNSGTGNLDEKLHVVTNGPDLVLGLNAKYLADILRVVGADAIEMKFNASNNPCVIQSASSEDDFFYLILPVRLKNA